MNNYEIKKDFAISKSSKCVNLHGVKVSGSDAVYPLYYHTLNVYIFGWPDHQIMWLDNTLSLICQHFDPLNIERKFALKKFEEIVPDYIVDAV